MQCIKLSLSKPATAFLLVQATRNKAICEDQTKLDVINEDYKLDAGKLQYLRGKNLNCKYQLHI